MRKKNRSKKESKSVEVKVTVPITGSSFMAILLIALLVLVGYSGYLGVKSIWKFTHPRFEISADTFKAVAYAAKSTTIPSFSIPPLTGDRLPDDATKASFLESARTFKSDFAKQFANSYLLRIPDIALVEMGWTFCKAKQKSVEETGTYSADEIITEYQSKFVLKYINLRGLDIFLSGIGQSAFKELCKDA